MRIAVGGFMHETNTFGRAPTTWTISRAAARGRGDRRRAISHPSAASISRSPISSQPPSRPATTWCPLAWACAQPAGRVTDAAFERMAGKLVEGARRARPDAVFLELHGAMVTESHDDGEGELLRRVRAAVGDDVPILVSLDLHANVSRANGGAGRLHLLLPHLSAYRLGRFGRTLRRMARPRARLEAPGARVPAGAVPDPGDDGLHLCRAVEGALSTAAGDRGRDQRASVAEHGFSARRHCRRRAEHHRLWRRQAEVDAAADRLYLALLAAEPGFAAHRPLPAAEAVAEAMRSRRRRRVRSCWRTRRTIPAPARPPTPPA